MTREAGLRGVLGQTIIQFPVADAKTPAEGLARTEAFLKEFAGDELITPAVAPHAMYTLDAATLKASRALADNYKAPVLIHLAETADESQTSQKQHKMSPTRYLESLGFWGPRTLAAHGVWLDAADIEILAKRKVGVSHNPESNMKLASGTAKVPAMRKAGDRRRPRHRRRRQQQRSRHVRGDAPGGVPAQADDRATRARCRRGRRSRWRRSKAPARCGMDGPHRLARSRQARRPDRRLDGRRAADADVRSDLAPRLRRARRAMSATTIVNGKVLMRDRKVLTLERGGRASAKRTRSRQKVREAVKK